MRAVSHLHAFSVYLAIAVSAILLSCLPTPKNELQISFYTGDVTIERNSSPVAVRIKEKVLEGDIISIGSGSAMVLQYGEGIVIRLEENTVARISSLQDVMNREIALEKGRILSSVTKLKKGETYSIKTPTVLASVRGTRFLTEYSDTKSLVAVSDGKVNVKRSDGRDSEKTVESGKTAVAETDTPSLKIRDIDKEESRALSRLEKTPFVEAFDTQSPDAVKKIMEEAEKAIEESENNRNLTLAELKEKYGRIDVITLYNGRVIQGIIRSRGKSFSVLTPGGEISIKASTVKRTDVR